MRWARLRKVPELLYFIRQGRHIYSQDLLRQWKETGEGSVKMDTVEVILSPLPYYMPWKSFMNCL